MTDAFDIKSSRLDSGVHVLEASAGTGKTFTIEGLVLRFLLEKQMPIEKVLLVTFTEAATAELRFRVRQCLSEAESYYSDDTKANTGRNGRSDLLDAILKNARITSATAVQRLRSALLLFDQARIFTIHGFCRRSLQEFSFECGYLFDAEMLDDAAPLTESAVNDYWRKHFISGNSKLHAALILSRGSVRKNYVKVLTQLLRNPDATWSDLHSKKSFAEILKWMEIKCEALKKMFLSESETVASILLKEDWGNKGYKRADLEHALIDLKNAAETNNFSGLIESFRYFSIKALAEAKNKTRKTLSLPEHRFFDSCVDWNDSLEIFYKADLQHFAEFSKNRLLEAKVDMNVRDFNDLLADMWYAVSENNPRSTLLIHAIRSAYSAALIDEFQDTDMRQWEIFRRLFVDKINGTENNIPLFLIGDPKQAIYSFRGGDIFTYLNAKKSCGQEKTLTTNYRSDARLVSVVNALFSKKRNVFELKGLDFHEVNAAGEISENEPINRSVNAEPPFCVTLFDYDRDLTKTICTLLVKDCIGLLNRGVNITDGNGAMRILSPGDICVLVRDNTEGMAVRDALSDRGVPVVFRGSISIFRTEEAEDVLLLMKALTTKRARGFIHASMASVLFSAKSDASLFYDDKAFEEEFDYLISLGEVWEREGFARMCAKLFHERHVRASVLSMKNGERRLTNFLQLIQILQEKAIEHDLSPIALTRWLEGRLSDNALSSGSEIYEQRLESDADAVQILTIHKSKGLEFPVCFCAFHSNDLRIESRNLNTWHDDTGKTHFRLEGILSEDQAARARTEAASEALRLLYVSLTRAKYQCYLYFGIKTGGGKENSSVLNLLCEDDFASALRSNYFNIPGGSMRIIEEDMRLYDGDLPIYKNERENESDIHAAVFSGKIPSAKRLTSFSSMIASQQGGDEWWADGRDVDDEAESASEFLTDTTVDLPSLLPKGTAFGEFMHKLFEFLPECNFSAEEALSKAKEGAADIHVDEAIVKELCERVLSSSLSKGKETFALKDIPQEKWMREWAFYFPLKQLSPGDLKRVFSRFGKKETEAVSLAMDRLNFIPIQGFVRGFIDLIFEYKGKFYILDWKSNWIGDTPDAYTSEAVLKQMTEHNYFLQYHLYTLALHRYLKTKLVGYDYKKHFGGIFYLFVRGVHPGKKGNGIFYDCPDEKLITALESTLISETVENK